MLKGIIGIMLSMAQAQAYLAGTNGADMCYKIILSNFHAKQPNVSSCVKDMCTECLNRYVFRYRSQHGGTKTKAFHQLHSYHKINSKIILFCARHKGLLTHYKT